MTKLGHSFATVMAAQLIGLLEWKLANQSLA